MSLFKKGAKKNGPHPFKDVFTSDYYYEPIVWAVANDIVKGTKPDVFDPDSGCTRGQAITFIWRAAGCPRPKAVTSPFLDVKESDYSFEAIMWAVENGIGSEIGEGIFAENASCARAQFLTFLHRSVGAPAPTKREHDFVDINERDFYYDAVMWALEKGITGGIGEGAFGPYTICTRGQVITFLYRYYHQ